MTTSWLETDQPLWTVGALARRTGVSVRTLHHYDAVGLLSPSRRSGAGYRLYTADDVARLQQIRSLRQIGLGLNEIRGYLDRSGHSPRRVVELHVARLREQIAQQQRLCQRLEALAERFGSADPVSTEELVDAIEEITMTERVNSYYTPEQLEQLAARRRELGEEGMRRAETDWQELMAAVQAEMDRGTDPSEPRPRELARRWTALVQSFTGGDPGIQQSLNRLWREETTVHGIDAASTRAMGEYVQRALEADRAS